MFSMPVDEIIAKLKKNHLYRADYEIDSYIQIVYDATKAKFEVKIESVDMYDKPIASYEYFDEQKLFDYLLKHQENIGEWRIY